MSEHGYQQPFLEKGIKLLSPITGHIEEWNDATARNRYERHVRQFWIGVRYTIAHIVVPFVAVIAAFCLSHMMFKEQTRNHQIYKSYGSDKQYMSLDKKYDHLWAQDIRTPMMNLTAETAPDPAAIGTEGGIAMFHTLHCLAGVRKALQKAHYDEERPGLDWRFNEHWPHCIFHLRQAILCQADDTIEVPRLLDGKLTGGAVITGIADVRKCGSSEALYSLQAREVAAGRGNWGG